MACICVLLHLSLLFLSWSSIFSLCLLHVCYQRRVSLYHGPRTPCAVVLFLVVLPFPALPCPFLLLSSPAARGCCSPVRPAVASGAIHTCCVVWRCAVCLYWFHRTVLLLQTPPCRLRSNTDIYITLLLPPVSASASASRSASRTASHVALPRSPPTCDACGGQQQQQQAKKWPGNAKMGKCENRKSQTGTEDNTPAIRNTCKQATGRRSAPAPVHRTRRAGTRPFRNNRKEKKRPEPSRVCVRVCLYIYVYICKRLISSLLLPGIGTRLLTRLCYLVYSVLG